MAVVGLAREFVKSYLVQGVVVACENSPRNVTLSGDKGKLKEVVEKIKEDVPDVFSRNLRVEAAYHSPYMLEVSEAYKQSIETCSAIQGPMVPFYSTVTAGFISNTSELDPSYWKKNLESPVEFFSAAQAALKMSTRKKVFVEIGPHSVLSGPLRQIFMSSGEAANSSYVPTVIRDEKERPEASLLKMAGELYISGTLINLGAINGRGNLLRDLPPYPWQHDKRHWSESRVVQNWRLRQYPHHELLGSRTLESTELEPCWRNVLCFSDVSWLYDHRIDSRILFPGACYVAMAGEAIQQLTSCEEYQIDRMTLKTALFIDEDKNIELITSLRPQRISDVLDSQ